MRYSIGSIHSVPFNWVSVRVTGWPFSGSVHRTLSFEPSLYMGFWLKSFFSPNVGGLMKSIHDTAVDSQAVTTASSSRTMRATQSRLSEINAVIH